MEVKIFRYLKIWSLSRRRKSCVRPQHNLCKDIIWDADTRSFHFKFLEKVFNGVAKRGRIFAFHKIEIFFWTGSTVSPGRAWRGLSNTHAYSNFGLSRRLKIYFSASHENEFFPLKKIKGALSLNVEDFSTSSTVMQETRKPFFLLLPSTFF